MSINFISFFSHIVSSAITTARSSPSPHARIIVMVGVVALGILIGIGTFFATFYKKSSAPNPTPSNENPLEGRVHPLNPTAPPMGTTALPVSQPVVEDPAAPSAPPISESVENIRARAFPVSPISPSLNHSPAAAPASDLNQLVQSFLNLPSGEGFNPQGGNPVSPDSDSTNLRPVRKLARASSVQNLPVVAVARGIDMNCTTPRGVGKSLPDCP